MRADIYYSIKLRAGAVEYELAHDIDAFTLDGEAARPSQLEVTVGDPFHVFGHVLREGVEVEVDLGQRAEHAVVFRGRIYRVESDFPADAVPTVRFIAHDDRMRMGLRQRSRKFVNVKLSQLVERVAGAYFNEVQTTDLASNPSFGENGCRQTEQTDLDFLLALADKFECQMLLASPDQGGRLRWASNSRLRKGQPSQTFYYRRSGVQNLLTSFRPLVDTSRVRLPKVQAAAHPDTGEATGVFTRPAGPAPEVRDDFFDDNLARLAERDPERSVRLGIMAKAAEMASLSLSKEIGDKAFGAAPPFVSETQRAEWEQVEVSSGLLGMEAQASLDGMLAISPARMIRVENVGARFSGDWYLRKVRHLFDQSGHRTELECER